MADALRPAIRSEQATRPLLYELGGTFVGDGFGADAGGGVERTASVAVGDAVTVGSAAAVTVASTLTAGGSWVDGVVGESDAVHASANTMVTKARAVPIRIYRF